VARSHNPFAPVEASKMETPWGVFAVASPNKARTKAIGEIQREAKAAGDDPDPMLAADLGIRICAAGLEDGDTFLEAARAAWDAGDLTLAQINGAAEFVKTEMTSAAGND